MKIDLDQDELELIETEMSKTISRASLIFDSRQQNARQQAAWNGWKGDVQRVIDRIRARLREPE